jgi:hypothetical protein
VLSRGAVSTSVSGGRGKRVRFCRVTELITQLMEAREERELGRLKKQLSRLDLLVLDELGYVPASKLGAELLFDVISTAYACCPDCDRVAARYTDGVDWEVFSGCGQSNGAYDINDLGDVVMRLNIAPYVRFEGIGTFLIEDLIVADVGHWYVINGFGLVVNNARQMAVPARNLVTDETGVILLTPFVVGDLDGDGDVDLSDLAALPASYGARTGDPGFNPAADLDSRGCVDLADLATLLANYGT